MDEKFSIYFLPARFDYLEKSVAELRTLEYGSEEFVTKLSHILGIMGIESCPDNNVDWNVLIPKIVFLVLSTGTTIYFLKWLAKFRTTTFHSFEE